MATMPAKPLLGLYNLNGTFAGPPASWNSGPTTNIANQYFAMDSSSPWSDFGAPFVAQCDTAGLTAFIEIEPWAFSQAPVLFSAITGGTWDTFLEDIGTSIAGSSRPVIITFAHEMNVSGQYPWSYNTPGSGPGGGQLTPAQWITGWKYVRAKVNSTANGNALWMWACSANTGGSSTTSPSAWWPGITFLDAVGVDGYEALEGSPTNFNAEFASAFADIRAEGWAGDIYIAETNLALMVADGGDSITTFVTDMFNAGCSGILEWEDSGLQVMSGTQWTTYNAAVASVYGGGGGGGGGTPPATGKFATLTDAFPGTALAAQWTVTGSGTVSVAGGQAGIPCTAAYGQIQTAAAYDLTSSQVVLKVTPFIGTDSGSYATQILLGDQAAANGYMMAYDDGQLTCYSYVNFVGTTAYASATYSAASMAYWKISEAGGTITFAYSADGVAWTTLGTTHDETIVAPASMYASISAGWYSTTGTNGTSFISNFNTSAGGGGTGGGPGGGGDTGDGDGMASLWYDNTVIAGLGAQATLLNGGTIKVYTGAQPSVNGSLTGTLLVTLTFGSPAFGTATATSGVATAAANTITSGTAVASGNAGYFALVTSGGATMLTGTVGVSGSGDDLIISAVAITSGTPVSCSAFALTQSETGS